MTERAFPLGAGRLGGEVLVELALQRATGTLRWDSGGVTVRLRDGRPAAASQADRWKNERGLVEQMVRRLVTGAAGTMVFRAEAHNQPALSLDTLGEVLVALQGAPESALRPWWENHRGATCAQTETFGRLAQALRKVGGPVLPASSEPMAVETVLATDIAGLRAWTAMMLLGGATWVQSAPGPNRVVGSSVPQDPQAREVFREIRDRHRSLTDQSHYAVLGVDASASVEKIRERYFEEVKKWHSDSLAPWKFDSATLGQAEDVFRAVEEANRVLSDPEERKSYDYYLDRRARGLPTDPEVVMRAEGLFRKAQALVRRGQAAAAEPLLAEALELNKGEAEFLAYHGYTLYSAKGSSALTQARAKLREALKMNPRLDAAHEFLGRIARIEGENAVAERELMRAMELNPENVSAERELRFVQRRKGQSSTAGNRGLGGLFNRVFKR